MILNCTHNCSFVFLYTYLSIIVFVHVFRSHLNTVLNPLSSHPMAEAAASAARARPRANSDSNITVHNNNNQSTTADPEKVAQLCGMGFTPDQASGALLAYNNDVSKACNHLLGM